MKRVSVFKSRSMCVQPAFIIGTYDEKGTANFAPITWLSVTWDTDRYLLVVSMFGKKKTKMNTIATGRLSANLVSRGMIQLMDYFGSASGNNGEKKAIPFEYDDGEAVRVPVLRDSRWVYECEVARTVTTGDSDTFFCEIKNVQIDETLDLKDGGYDLFALDPVIYSGGYYTLGEFHGKIGEIYRREK